MNKLCYNDRMNDNIFDKLKQIKKIAGASPQIVAGYLFGSYAINRQTKGSDIDLGFICFYKKNLDVLSFSLTVGKLFPSCKTDVVVCDLKEKPIILTQMLKGKVIYEKSTPERVLLENRILKLSEDYLYLASIKNHYLSRSFAKGIYANR